MQLIRRLLGELQHWLSRRRIDTRETDPEFVRTALEEQVPGFGDSVHRIPLDGQYYLSSRATVHDRVATDITSFLPYERERFDCENFALLFAGLVARDYGLNGVGIVVDHSADHAYNLLVYASGTVELYEPQTGEFLPVDVDDEQHPLDSGVILI